MFCKNQSHLAWVVKDDLELLTLPPLGWDHRHVSKRRSTRGAFKLFLYKMLTMFVPFVTKTKYTGAQQDHLSRLQAKIHFCQGKLSHVDDIN